MRKNLIIYFSHPGENYFGGTIKEIDKGNTKKVAEYIQEVINGDLFEVETIKDYPNDYYETVAISREELKNNERPKLKKSLESVDDYENIVVAGPIWCGTYPMVLFSQLDKLDLNGKNIIPITTHEGSGFAKVKTDLKLYKGATVKEGLAIKGSDVDNSAEKIKDWAKKNLK